MASNRAEAHLHIDATEDGARGAGLGLPSIDQVDQLYDACLTDKQKRSSFPGQAQWRAEHVLELVHGDLCGPISPATPSGSTYFLLLVDDKSLMWVSTLVTKAHAVVAIREFQSRAEGEFSCKLRALCTDRGGEFNSKTFTEYWDSSALPTNGTIFPHSKMVSSNTEMRWWCMLKVKDLPVILGRSSSCYRVHLTECRAKQWKEARGMTWQKTICS
jgi:hypothetical protein